MRTEYRSTRNNPYSLWLSGDMVLARSTEWYDIVRTVRNHVGPIKSARGTPRAKEIIRHKGLPVVLFLGNTLSEDESTIQFVEWLMDRHPDYLPRAVFWLTDKPPCDEAAKILLGG